MKEKKQITYEKIPIKLTNAFYIVKTNAVTDKGQCLSFSSMLEKEKTWEHI